MQQTLNMTGKEGRTVKNLRIRGLRDQKHQESAFPWIRSDWAAEETGGRGKIRLQLSDPAKCGLRRG